MLFIQALFVIWAICPSAVIAGVVNTPLKSIEATNKASKNSTSSEKKNKRLVDSQTAELSLLQAGVLLAETPFLSYGDPIFDPYGQYNHSGAYPNYGTSDLHQGEAPLVASRHPTKPVYHYTPLPQGTFPAKTIPNEKQTEEEVPNRSGNEYWYDYLVRDGDHGLALGQREARQGNIVRGIYHVLLPDRRMQVVQYWSDWSGYHPTITYSYP